VPFFAIDWYRIESAAASGDWGRVVVLVEKMQSFAGGESPSTLFWLGSAYLAIGRFQDAVNTFDRIESTGLKAGGDRARKALNHAVALDRIGRRNRAAEMLLNSFEPDWPSAARDKVTRTLISFGIDEQAIEDALEEQLAFRRDRRRREM
jgi:tetratricopeptide (TPR) repeat protein